MIAISFLNRFMIPRIDNQVETLSIKD